MKKSASTLLLAALMLGASMGVQSEPQPQPELVTICYYGVTMQVSQKIAQRYVKIGATYGPCGQVPS